jgi:hypothetical protein
LSIITGRVMNGHRKNETKPGLTQDVPFSLGLFLFLGINHFRQQILLCGASHKLQPFSKPRIVDRFLAWPENFPLDQRSVICSTVAEDRSFVHGDISFRPW